MSIQAKKYRLLIATKYFVAFMFLLLCGSNGYASKKDSLITIFNSDAHDTTRLRSALQLVKIYSKPALFDSAKYFLKLASEIAEKQSDKIWQSRTLYAEARAYERIGEIDLADEKYRSAIDFFRVCEEYKEYALILSDYGTFFAKQGNFEKALRFMRSSFRLREVLMDSLAMSDVLMDIGNVYSFSSRFDLALETFKRAQILAERLKDQENIGIVSGSISQVYVQQGKFNEALQGALKALKIFEQQENIPRLLPTYGLIGNIYYQLSENKKAEEYLTKSLDLAKKVGDPVHIGSVLNSLGQINSEQGNYELAIQYLNEAAQIAKKVNNIQGYTNAISNLAALLAKTGNIEKAIASIDESIEVLQTIDYKMGLAIAYGDKGHIYSGNKQYKESIPWFIKAVNLATEMNAIDQQRLGYKNIYFAFKQIGKSKEALIYYKKFILLRDSIFNEANTKKAIELEMNYAYEKKEMEEQTIREVGEREERMQAKRENIILISLAAILLIVVVFSVVVFKNYRNRKLANEEIIRQKEIIEEKQKEILDSIFYARRIQTALITSEYLVQKELSRLMIQ